MGIGHTTFWAHGSAIQYNSKEFESQFVVPLYTRRGFEIGRAGERAQHVRAFVTLFLPIPTPSEISDERTAVKELQLRYSTKDADAAIEALSLRTDDTLAFDFADLNLPLKEENCLGKPPPGVMTSWQPPTNVTTLLVRDGNQGLFLEIGVTLRASQKLATVVIAGAGVVFEHTKFDED